MKIDKLIKYIFYINLVVEFLSLTKLPIGIFHTDYFSIVVFLLNCFILFYLLRNKMSPMRVNLSFVIILLYVLIFCFSYRTFNIDWSALLLVTFVPLITFHDESFIRNVLAIKVSITLLIMLLFFLGVVEETTLSKLNTIGHSVGFFHPNTLGSIIFSIVCDILILFRNKSNHLHLYLIPILISFIYIFYKITYSRTSMIMTMILIACLIFKNILCSFKFNKTTLLASSSLIMILGTSVSMFYSPSNAIYVKLDSFLTNRLYLGNLYIHRYGFTLLPKLINNIVPAGWWSSDALFIDNNYLKFVLSQGLIISVMIFIYILYNIFVNQYTLYTGLIILAVLTYLIIEAQGFNIFLFTPLLFNYISEGTNGNFLERRANNI